MIRSISPSPKTDSMRNYCCCYYQISANILLALAEEEGGKLCQWIRNANGTYDVGTMQFISWLKNRRPQDRRDKVEIKEKINYNPFTPKEVLDAIYEKALKKAAERHAMLKDRRQRLAKAGIDFKKL